MGLFKSKAIRTPTQQTASWQEGMPFKGPTYPPANYFNLSRQGYESVITAYSCITKIATGCASVPLGIKRREEYVDQHALLDLFKRPAREYSKFTFLEAALTYKLISGNCFIEKVRNQSGSRIVELVPLRPDRMQIVADETGPIGYVYNLLTPALSVQVPYEYDELIHDRLFHPTDDWWGLSPLQVARRDLQLSLDAIDYNVAFFQNNARPDGYFTVPSTPYNPTATIGEDEFKRVQKQWRARFKGKSNWRKTPFMQGGLEYKNFSISQQDMQFIELYQLNERDICKAFGVPPPTVGLYEGASGLNADIMKTAKRVLWEDTIVPHLIRFQDSLDAYLAGDFEAGIDIVFKLEEVKALQEDETALYERLNGAVDRGILLINEAREILKKPAVYGGDWLWKPITAEPVTKESMEPEPAAPPPPPSPTAKAIEAYERKEQTATKARVNRAELSGRRRRLAGLEKRIKGYEGRMKRLFQEQENEVSKNIRESAKGMDGLKTKAAAVIDPNSEFFNRSAWQEKFSGVGDALNIEIGQAGADSAVALFGLDAEWNLVSERVTQSVMARSAETWAKVNELTQGMIREQVTAGLEKGATIDQLMYGDPDLGLRGIKGVFAECKDSRAATIARTETGYAYNQGTVASYEMGGVKGVYVIDGQEPNSCDECIQYAGMDVVWSLEEAAANPLEHPNCSRDFAPVVEALD